MNRGSGNEQKVVSKLSAGIPLFVFSECRCGMARCLTVWPHTFPAVMGYHQPSTLAPYLPSYDGLYHQSMSQISLSSLGLLHHLFVNATGKVTIWEMGRS